MILLKKLQMFWGMNVIQLIRIYSISDCLGSTYMGDAKGSAEVGCSFCEYVFLWLMEDRVSLPHNFFRIC